jgi:hypothetical protein
MTASRRSEALRRLGGPVCPVCETVGAANIEVRFMSSDGSQWLAQRGKRHLERESLAPMCQHCFLTMENNIVMERSIEARRRAQAEAQSVADAMRLSQLDGPKYREACAEHEDDLTAAEQMAAEWGVGNGLFGSRGE